MRVKQELPPLLHGGGRWIMECNPRNLRIGGGADCRHRSFKSIQHIEPAAVSIHDKTSWAFANTNGGSASAAGVKANHIVGTKTSNPRCAIGAERHTARITNRLQSIEHRCGGAGVGEVRIHINHRAWACAASKACSHTLHKHAIDILFKAQFVA